MAYPTIYTMHQKEDVAVDQVDWYLQDILKWKQQRAEYTVVFNKKFLKIIFVKLEEKMNKHTYVRI